MSAKGLNLAGYNLVSDMATMARAHALKRDHFPRLTSDSSTERMDAVLQRQGLGRVNLPAALKRFMKQRFPLYKFDHSIGDLHRFTSIVSEKLSLYVEFERIHHYGLGKTFAVWIGALRHDIDLNGRHGFRCSLLSFFDRSSMNWTYGAAEDLEACLDEVSALLAIVLEPYGSAWEILDVQDASSGMHMTFHQAAEVAYRNFEDFYPQFSAMGHASCATGGWGIVPAGTWSVSFYDNEADRALRVDVLLSGKCLYAVGNQAFIRRGDLMSRAHPRRYVDEHLALPAQPSPSAIIRCRPWEEFLDSPAALEIAQRNGGADFAAQCSDFTVQLQFHAQRSDPPCKNEEWRVFYHDHSPARLHDNVKIHARTGLVL